LGRASTTATNWVELRPRKGVARSVPPPVLSAITCGPVCSCRGSAMLKDDGLGDGRAGAPRAGRRSWSGGGGPAPPPASRLVREAVEPAGGGSAVVLPS